ncbi:MAG: hypothetical protein MJ107_02440 [Lachnospiraceae bacterium]|nr:hypothetical protein [Lachnospiraceae bacterium]
MDKFLCLMAELDEDVQKGVKACEEILDAKGFLDKKTRDIPCHFTINSFPVEEEENLKLVLNEIKDKFKQTEVSFSGIGLFGLRVVYLNPTMNQELLDLYNLTKEKALNKFDGYSAHATLFIGEDEETLSVIKELSTMQLPAKGVVKDISLYEFFPTRFIARVELNK